MAEEEKNEKKVVLKPIGKPAVDPSKVTQMATPGGSMVEDTRTQKQARRTIKLKPIKPSDETVNAAEVEETMSFDRESIAKKADVSPEEEVKTVKVKKPTGFTQKATVSATASQDEDETIKIQKPAAATQTAAAPNVEETIAATRPTIPGAKQTIKLRPSTPQPTQEATAAPSPPEASKPTIKLKPKTGSPVSGEKEAGPQPPQAKRTIRLKPTDSTAQAPQPPSPSDPTVKLQETGTPKHDEVTKKLPEEQPEPKRKLSIRKDTTATSADQQLQATGTEDAAAISETEDEITSRDEPSIIFTIITVLSLMVIGFLAFMTTAQFLNQWKNAHITVPGISGKVK